MFGCSTTYPRCTKNCTSCWKLSLYCDVGPPCVHTIAGTRSPARRFFGRYTYALMFRPDVLGYEIFSGVTNVRSRLPSGSDVVSWRGAPPSAATTNSSLGAVSVPYVYEICLPSGDQCGLAATPVFTGTMMRGAPPDAATTRM